MKVPLELSFRDVEKTEAIVELVTEQAAKLERICNYLTSCRVVIEKPQKPQQSGSPYRVRVDLTVPPGHEIVAKHNSDDDGVHGELTQAIRRVFDAAKRQLHELVEKQRRDVKNHYEPTTFGMISSLFKDEGYGFIDTVDGRTVYFHKNSVLHSDFDRMEVGTGVRFFPEIGEKGPQASTVQISDKTGE